LNKLPNKWIFLLLNYGMITILFLIFTTEYTLEHFINIVFYVFLVCSIVMLFLYIKKGGFFDGLAFSFSRFKSVVSKDISKIDSWKEKPPPSKKVNKKIYTILPFQLLWQFILLSVLLLIYYFTT